jgi:PadR family transcriptional regulator, regulatory protein PadR
MPRESLQGTLDLLILKTLARGVAHGYGITCAILNASQNQLRVEEGSLYPALRRLEADGFIKAEWRPSENNRRARYYELTRAGQKRLRQVEAEWRSHAAVVEGFLTFEE